MPALQGLNLHRNDRGKRTTIILTGEIDLDTAPQVRVTVDNCLREEIRTIEMDLAGLAFCDVSGLNAFLAAAARTTEAGGSLHLLHARPMLIRLLTLTGAGFLKLQAPPAPHSLTAAAGPAVQHRLLAS